MCCFATMQCNRTSYPLREMLQKRDIAWPMRPASMSLLLETCGLASLFACHLTKMRTTGGRQTMWEFV